jgi:hypothetical protein
MGVNEHGSMEVKCPAIVVITASGYAFVHVHNTQDDSSA